MTADHPNPELERLEQELTALAQSSNEEAFSGELRARLLQAATTMRDHRSSSSALEPERAWRNPVRGRRLVFATTAFVVVALGGLVGFSHLLGSSTLSGPAPASAATLLRQAAARALAAGDAGHFTYVVTLSDPSAGIDATGRVDAWYEQRPDGSSVSVQTLTLSKSAAQPQRLFGRFLQLGRDLYAYDAAHEKIVLPSDRQDVSALVLPNVAFSGAELAQSLKPLADGGHAKLLPQRTIDGHTVDVVQVDGGLDTPALQAVFFFDTQSQLLRGFDAASTDPSYPTPSWHVRLIASATLASDAVPAGTFSLAAPADTPISPPRPNKQAILALCGPSLVNHVGSVPLLQACQAANPSLSQSEILHRLTQTARAELDAAVAAGQISRSQADAGLIAARDQLKQTLITSRSK